jgi:DNA-binding GntR family transcriptional regulator
MTQISAPVSVGELLDKMAILQIKSERIGDEAKLANVRRELEVLGATWQASGLDRPELAPLKAELKKINEALWEIEDLIRIKESEGDFDQQFIELARSVYVTNDRRAAVKRQINEAVGSELVEEKSYADYTRPA